MKLRTTLYSFAAVLLLGSISLIGCTTEDEPGTGSDGITRVGTTTSSTMEVGSLTEGQRYVFAVKGGAGTVIKGLSSNGSTSIIVTWTRGATDGGVDSIFYKKVDAATSTLTVDGTVYTAQTWATASKFGPVTLYEDGQDDGTAGHLSGMTITGTGVTTVSTRFGADVNNYDFKLRTTPAANPLPNLVLEPGFRNNTNDIRHAEMADANSIYVVDGGADKDYYSGNFNSQMTFHTDNYWVVPAVDGLGNAFAIGANAMIPVKIKQADGTTHYARIEVVSAPNLNTVNALWHEAAQRSITVNVYYQTVADWDYATPREAGNGGH